MGGQHRPGVDVQRPRPVEHEDGQVGRPDPVACGDDGGRLNRVVGRPYARRVDQHDGQPAQVGQFADPVPCGPGRVGRDRPLLAEQLVGQRRLADVGRPHDRDRRRVRQPPPARVGEHGPPSGGITLVTEVCPGDLLCQKHAYGGRRGCRLERTDHLVFQVGRGVGRVVLPVDGQKCEPVAGRHFEGRTDDPSAPVKSHVRRVRVDQNDDGIVERLPVFVSQQPVNRPLDPNRPGEPPGQERAHAGAHKAHDGQGGHARRGEQERPVVGRVRRHESCLMWCSVYASAIPYSVSSGDTAWTSSHPANSFSASPPVTTSSGHRPRWVA